MTKALKSLSAKIMAGIGGATVALVGGAMLLSGIESSERTRETVYREAVSTAGTAASTVTQDITALSSAVSTMTAVIGAAKDSDVLNRQMILAMMQAIVAKYDLAFGVTFIEEDGAWDGQRGPSLVGNNTAGDFASYWSKENGPINFTAVATTRDDPWYKVPATTRRPTLTEPFVYDSGTKQISMTTIAYPVISGGKLLGVGSFDVNLETLSNAIAKLRPFETGHVMLVSGAGSWLATPDAGLFMKPYKGEGEAELRTALSTGKPQTLHNFNSGAGAVERIIYPFAMPGLYTNWAAIVDVPSDVLAAPIQRQALVLAGTGVLILGIMLLALYFSTVLIVRRPLHSLLKSVECLKHGHFEVSVSGQGRNDEIGDLSRSLDGFRLALLRGQAIEADANLARSTTEKERQEAEATRHSIQADQEFVVTSISQALTQLSAGNLTYRVTDGFPDKFESLRNDFNSAVQQLHNSLSAVSRSATMIDGGISEISSSTDDLSRRTEQQAASLEETAAALNEITVNLANAAERANDARTVAIHANASAKESRSVVAGAIDAMERIERSSATISSIVGVIDEIAFQTNLLALNAGVEAARAGEAGKGFAVVAQEVRELAQRSAKAAKEIKELIHNSNCEVENGVKLVSDTGRALTTIENYIIEINKHIESIVVSAQEQSVGLSEVNTAVDHMDQFMQKNAAMVEETNAAGMSLADEAGQLRQLVTRFRLQTSQHTFEATPRRSTLPSREPLRLSLVGATRRDV